MKISVITVSYNAAATIEDTLRSVAAQTHSEIEHIVVDGASRDGTREILERYRGSLAQLISEPDQGIYDAMNKGIRLATGDIVGTLNADDIYADNSVLARVAQVFQDPSVEACYGDLVYVDKDDPAKIRRYWESHEYRPGMFSRGWMPAHPTFFVRREVYRRCGLFDTRYRLQSDFELTMRFLEVCHIKSVYLPGILVRMRMGGATNRSVLNVLRGNWEAYQACHAHAIKVSPLFFLRKTASRIPQFFRRPPLGSDAG